MSGLTQTHPLHQLKRAEIAKQQSKGLAWVRKHVVLGRSVWNTKFERITGRPTHQRVGVGLDRLEVWNKKLKGLRRRGSLTENARLEQFRNELPNVFVGRADIRIAYALPRFESDNRELMIKVPSASLSSEFLALAGAPPLLDSPGAFLRLSPRLPGAPSASAA